MITINSSTIVSEWPNPSKGTAEGQQPYQYMLSYPLPIKCLLYGDMGWFLS